MLGYEVMEDFSKIQDLFFDPSLIIFLYLPVEMRKVDKIST